MASAQQDLREALARTRQALYEVQAELEAQIRKNGRMSRRCQETEAQNVLLRGDNTTLLQALESLQREHGALARRHGEEQEAQSKTKRALLRALSAAFSLIGELRERNEARRNQGVVGTRLSFWDFLPEQMSEERPLRLEDR
jgi:dynactin complex subunit